MPVRPTQRVGTSSRPPAFPMFPPRHGDGGPRGKVHFIPESVTWVQAVPAGVSARPVP
jgi:hypothetical protein